MGISNIESRTPVIAATADGLDKSASAGHPVQKSSTRILDGQTASQAVPKGPLLQLLDEELLAPQDFPADFGATVDEARRLLADLKPDEARCDLYAILALMMRSANEHRQAQREIRHAGYETQAALLVDAAQKIRDSAQMRMWGSIAAGAFEGIGGVVSIAGGVTSFRASMQSADFLKESRNPLLAGNQELIGNLEASAESLEVWARTLNTVAPGVAHLSNAVGTVVKAPLDNIASQFDAQKAELDATVRKQEQVTQEVNEHMQQQLDVIRDVLEKLRSMEQSRSAINSGISRSL